MKLHLPKQLFTALLAAITLAAPAAWGDDIFYVSDSTEVEEKVFSTPASGVNRVLFDKADSDGSITNTTNITLEDNKEVWVGPGTATSANTSGKHTVITLSGIIAGNNGTLKFNEYASSAPGNAIYRLTNANSTFTGKMTLDRGGDDAADVQLSMAGVGEAFKGVEIQFRSNGDRILSIEGNTTLAGLSTHSNPTARVTSTSEDNILTLNVGSDKNLTYTGAIGSGTYYNSTNSTDTAQKNSTSLQLVKDGAGSQTINGTVNLSGLTVNEGTLTFSGSNSTLSGTVTNNATLNLAGFTVAEEASVSISGTGTTTLNGTNNGTLTVNSGVTLSGTLTNNATLNMNSFTVAADTAVTIEGTGTTTVAGTVTNAGTLTFGSSLTVAADTSLSLSGNIVFKDTIYHNGTNLDLTNATIKLDALQNFDIKKEGGNTYILNETRDSEGNLTTNTVGNGFEYIYSTEYWLVKGNSSIAGLLMGEENPLHHVNGTTYQLNEDSGNGIYFDSGDFSVYDSYYIKDGEVAVDAAAQKLVQEHNSTYVLNGGTMKITEGSVNTSDIAYESDASSISVADGATLVLDSEVNGLTAASLLGGKLSAKPATESAAPTGCLQIATDATLTNGYVSSFTGKVDLAAAKTLYVGGGQSAGSSTHTINLSTISEFILHNGSKIYYHANPNQDIDFNKIRVADGTGEFYLRDSNNAPLVITSVDVADSATFKYWSNWGDSSLTVGTLSGGGTFRVESPDQDANNSPKTIIESLTGFKGNLQFVKDSGVALNVEVNTGEGDGVSFNSITITNSNVENGEMDFDFNVETDTTVGTINVTGTNNTINIASTGTLHAFSKAGDGTITLTGSGKYALGNSYILTDRVTLADTWEGTLVYSYAARDNNITTYVTDLAGLKTSDKAVQISGAIGYLNAGDNNALGVDIVLEDPTDGYALTIANGNSDQTAIISGAVSGTGDIAFNPQYYSTNKWSWGNVKYQFSGNIADWTGKFIFQNTTTDANDVLTVIFSDNATSIHANLINNNIVDAANGILSANTSDKFNLEITNTQKVDVYGTVDVDKVTVTNTGETNFHSSLKAATVELGTAATITGKDGGTVSMDKVKMNATGISSADTTGATKGRISNAQLTQLQADASFTIQDMTLMNTTITAATAETRVNLSNVSASNLELAMGKFTMEATPTVGDGGNATFGTGVSSLSLTAGDATLTLNLDMVGAYESTGAVSGATLTIMLGVSGADLDFSKYTEENWQALVGFDRESWLGKALVDATFTTEAVAATAEAGSAAPTVSYGYDGGSNVGTLTITITGLNVPEPTTATLSLLALAALAARRRRND